MKKDISQMTVEDQVQQILIDPKAADSLTSSTLKKIIKGMAQVILGLGSRLQSAEDNYERTLLRLLEVTGGMHPEWSYIHKEEANRLHAFTSFSLMPDETGILVCGHEDGKLYPIYEFDFSDFGGTEGAHKPARLMLAHLRQTFLPRVKEPQNER